MRYKLKLLNFTKPKVKTQGSALLISIVLSGLMITVVIMSARLAVRELELSADLFLSEKAYFSAESGVEKALWQLKNNPINHVEESPGSIISELEDDHTEVSIRNLIDTTPDNFPEESFAFTLPPLESQKFRFQQDTDTSIGNSNSAVTGTVSMTLDSVGSYFWRLLCEDTSTGNTVALQAEASTNMSDFLNQSGKLDDGTETDFNSWSTVDKNSCYISIQNLQTIPVTYTFSGTTMAPHAAHIHAVGTHQGREKHIRFDYAQKTLGSLFDFSFLHSEGGLN